MMGDDDFAVGNVVPLRAIEPLCDEVGQSILDLAQDVLSRVKNGEIKGLAVAMVTDDKQTWTRVAKSSSRHVLLASILDLLFDYQRGG